MVWRLCERCVVHRVDVERARQRRENALQHLVTAEMHAEEGNVGGMRLAHVCERCELRRRKILENDLDDSGMFLVQRPAIVVWDESSTFHRVQQHRHHIKHQQAVGKGFETHRALARLRDREKKWRGFD